MTCWLLNIRELFWKDIRTNYNYLLHHSGEIEIGRSRVVFLESFFNKHIESFVAFVLFT